MEATFDAMRWNLAQWFEKRWWERYLKKKSKADYLAWKKNYWTTFLHSLDLQIDPSHQILDAGCGPAGIFIALENSKVTAVDPLIDYYSKNLDHFEPSDYPYCRFIEKQIEDLAFDQEFDHVFCLNVINHVRDINIALRCIAQTAAPGAQLVISIDCHNYKAPKWLFRALPLDILHPHQFNLSEYLALFETNQLSVVRVKRIRHDFLFDYYAVVLQKHS